MQYQSILLGLVHLGPPMLVNASFFYVFPLSRTKKITSKSGNQKRNIVNTFPIFLGAKKSVHLLSSIYIDL